VHWTANFDEIQDFENDIRNGFSGAGFLSDDQFETTSDPLGEPKAGLSIALDQMAAYVSSLDMVSDSPYRYSSRYNAHLRNRGKQYFDYYGCANCHSGPNYTDGRRHDVGTVQPSSGKGINLALAGVGFDTPTLKGLWNTAPYFHNGRASSLSDTLLRAVHLDSSSRVLTGGAREALVHFLLTLDDGPPIIDPVIVDFERTSTTDADGADRPHISKLLSSSFLYADNLYSTAGTMSAEANALYVGKTFLSTHYADVYQTADESLKFKVASAVSGNPVRSRVYIAFDSSAVALPNWLRRSNGWVKLSAQLEVTYFGNRRHLDIYRKSYAADEQVVLGGNKADGLELAAAATTFKYLVFVEEYSG
jgi:hypothetical protein